MTSLSLMTTRNSKTRKINSENWRSCCSILSWMNSNCSGLKRSLRSYKTSWRNLIENWTTSLTMSSEKMKTSCLSENWTNWRSSGSKMSWKSLERMSWNCSKIDLMTRSWNSYLSLKSLKICWTSSKMNSKNWTKNSKKTMTSLAASLRSYSMTKAEMTRSYSDLSC